MGSALRLHPLLVIFGLLAGGEIYGLPGALVALPLLAAGRAIWEFFAERVDARAVGRRAGRCRSRSSSRADAPLAPAPASGRPAGSGHAGDPRRRSARGARRRPQRSAGRRARADRPRGLRRRDARARRPERRGQVDAARAARGRARAERRQRRAAQRRAGRLGAAAARRSTAGSRRARTSSCSRGSRARPTPRRAPGGCSSAFELPDEAAPSAHLSVGNRQRLNLAIALLGEPARAAARRADRGARPRAAPRASGSGGRARARRAARSSSRRRTSTSSSATPTASPLLRDGRLVFAGPLAEYDRSQAESLFGVSRVLLLLRKDLLVLRRSPLLLGILIAYPLAIAVLVGLVAELREREAARRVRRRGQPAGDGRARRPPLPRRPDDRRGQQEREARPPRRTTEAERQLATGRVVAVVTVPPGFVATLQRHGARARSSSSRSRAARSRRASSSRCRRSSTRSTASCRRAYIDQQPPVRHADPARRRRQLPRPARSTCSGSTTAQRLLAELPQTPEARRCSGLRPRRAARARATPATRCARRRTRSCSSAFPKRGRTWLLSAAGAGLRARR